MTGITGRDRLAYRLIFCLLFGVLGWLTDYKLGNRLQQQQSLNEVWYDTVAKNMDGDLENGTCR